MAHLDNISPGKPTDLLDRDREWNRLYEAVSSPGPDLLLVFGRRRVGKSYLLTRFAREFGGFYYQATRKTEQEQLRSLSLRLGEHFADAALRRTTFPDWDAVLEYLKERAGDRPFVFVLDEFPYLSDAAPALPSIIQDWWDHRLTNTRITIVLSGSHLSAMKRLVEADQPLYGRRTGRLDIKPFDYLDTAKFVAGWDERDKMRLYGVFGGMPGHLALVDPEQSLDANAASHLFDSSGRLHDEAIHAFDTFVADAEVHYSIIDAIAAGEQRWSRISSHIGKQTSALSRPLEWLLDMEIIRRNAPTTGRIKANPKQTLYQITDPYFNFWHRFVAGVKQRGLAELAEPDALWKQFVVPFLDDYMGSVFENACRQFVTRGEHALIPFRPIEVGSWWNSDSSEEVDIVAIDGQGALLAAECKWGSIGPRDLTQLKRRADLVASEMGGIGSITYLLFSAGGLAPGITKNDLEADGGVHVPIETLYETLR